MSIIEQPEWYEELADIINQIGYAETSKELKVNRGTITTWLRMPQYFAEYNKLRAKRGAISSFEVTRLRTLELLFRLAPTTRNIEAIQKLWNLLQVHYQKIRYTWYLDKYLENIRKELHVRLSLSGTVPQKMLQGDQIALKMKLKEELKQAATATLFPPAAIIGMDGETIDLLFWFYNKYENSGTYGDIETFIITNVYEPQWDFYGYFKRGSEGDPRFTYEWKFKWRIDPWW